MINKIIEILPIVPCQEATRLMSLAMERNLSLKETVDLKLHLMVCSLCVQFSKQIQSLRRILNSYKPVSEKYLSDQIKARFKQILKSA